MDLSRILDRLERHHGAPVSAGPSDPFEQIVYENACYLVDDETRAAVFARLARDVGVTPRAIREAQSKRLLAAIGDGGMRPPMRAEKLRTAARLAEALPVPLAELVRGPVAAAKRALRQFPGIGDPGAEKILLFAGAQALLGLESNGLRVLLRLGYGKESPSYDRSWRSVRDAVADELPKSVPAVQRAHRLLRRHGQTLCRRTKPACDDCPLRDSCPSRV
jgi:endonuclease III